MTTPAGNPTYDGENLRLAYAQQVENVREAKRLQWQMTYLGLVALAALAGANQLQHPSTSSTAAYIFTGLGVVVAVVTSWFILKAKRNMCEYRTALEEIAEKLDDSGKPYLKRLLGVPQNYGSQSDSEPFLLIVAIVVGAVILGWLLLGGRTGATPPLLLASVPTVTGALPGWLQISERVVLDLAALATLIAVWVAIRALRESDKTARTLNDSLAVARAEQEKRHREHAALVLPQIDLLQARLNSVWRDGLAYDEVHPSLDIIVLYLGEIERDIGFADALSERASQIDPEVAAYAELVWRRIRGIRLALGHAQRNAPQDRATLDAKITERLDGEWRGHRARILQLAAEAAELLRRMEKSFPADATTINGMSRKGFLTKTGEGVGPPAKDRVAKMLKELSEGERFIKTEF